jgi:hypothetical protein
MESETMEKQKKKSGEKNESEGYLRTEIQRDASGLPRAAGHR